MKTPLTLENVIRYFEKEYSLEQFDADTNIKDRSIDGIDAVDMLENLGDIFDVSFEEFDFHRYFLEEIEISRALSWFGLRKVRPTADSFTVRELFEYMVENQKR
jgi:hypothetical protein